MKNCSKCDTPKDESEFNKRKGTKDGLQYYCKPCIKESVMAGRQTEEGKQAHRDANHRYHKTEKGKIAHDKAEKKWLSTEHGRAKKNELQRGYQYKRYKADPEYYHLKNRAYHAGCDVGILKQVRERDVWCQMCFTDKDLQFDHIYPQSLGGKGTLENLQLLCFACNNFKSNNLILEGGGGMLVMNQHELQVRS